MKKLVSSKYILSKGKYQISATKDCNGNISIYRQNFFNQPFVFKNSKPDVIKEIAKLIIEASNL